MSCSEFGMRPIKMAVELNGIHNEMRSGISFESVLNNLVISLSRYHSFLGITLAQIVFFIEAFSLVVNIKTHDIIYDFYEIVSHKKH